MKKAFTLIELLIVVLIIAILAAIAVPNFLEFQTRAKVSRVMSDHRTLATAIEAYTVDNERAPLDFTEWQGAGFSDHFHRHECYSQLTTPIAYITTWLSDPFADKKAVASAAGPRNEGKYYYYDQYYPSTLSGYTNEKRLARSKSYYWSLYSVGPNGEEIPPWIPDMLANPSGTNALGNVYDPTNGTVSRGKIYRTNHGVVEGKDFASQ